MATLRWVGSVAWATACLSLCGAGVHDQNHDGVTRLVCIGDSNTDGTSPEYEAWCEIIARRCPQWEVHSERPLGMSGATVTPALPDGWDANRQTRVALALDPDAIVYAAGTNDLLLGRSPAAILAEYQRLKRDAVETRSMFLASVPYWLGDDPRNVAVDATNALLRAWAPVVIDFTTAIPPAAYFGRYHFNAAGHAERARRALGVLDPERRCHPV